MKVLYDYQAFTMQKFGGISKCFCELISNFSSNLVPIIGIEESNNVHIKKISSYAKIKPITIDINTFVKRWPFRGAGRLYLLANRLFPILNTSENVNKRACVKLLKEGQFDVFHPTFYDDYYLDYLNGKPFVITIHDMMPELFPEYYSKNNKQIKAKRRLVNKADAIIAVSEQTKKDIINILDVPEDKIHVIYHGGPEIEKEHKSSPYTFPYFLYVGQRNAYKNFPQFLKDFSIFCKSNKTIKLVCTGPEFTEMEKNLIISLGLTKYIIHEFVTDDRLRLLYSNAEAFIYPSLYEGFGMPILEAYACGCPVILNCKSCFPEIAGEAALYFNSTMNDSNLPQVLMNFSSMTQQDKQNLIIKGYERLSLYSWVESAKKLYDVYQSII